MPHGGQLRSHLQDIDMDIDIDIDITRTETSTLPALQNRCACRPVDEKDLWLWGQWQQQGLQSGFIGRTRGQIAHNLTTGEQEANLQLYMPLLCNYEAVTTSCATSLHATSHPLRGKAAVTPCCPSLGFALRLDCAF